MAKALYRKYRPKKLAEVVGQEQVTGMLERELKQGRISHAYLFVGPRGTGKTSVARIFAHEINGFRYELEDDYVDIVEIDGASNRGIDDIRELREKVAIAPSEGKYKVYIIDEVHMLTTPAFNALLKTLEEPPAHVVFLMATTDVQKVPRTILSRAQVFTFKLAEPEEMQKFLRRVAKAEGIKIDDAALAVVTERGGGSFRDSLSILDQVAALGEGEITRDLVVAAMGLPEETEITRLLTAYTSGDLGEIAGALREVLSAGAKPELLAEGMIRKIVAEPRAEWLGLLARLPGVAAPFPEAKLLVAMTSEVVGVERGPGVQVLAGSGDRSASKSSDGKPAGARKNWPAAVERLGRATGEAGGVAAVSEGEAVMGGEVVGGGEAVANGGEVAVNRRDGAAASEGGGAFPFDWGTYKVKVSEQNDAVARQLDRVQFELREGVLHLYPERKVVKNILGREKNLAILAHEAVGLRVELHEFGEKPEGGGGQPSERLARLADIMGGEVVVEEGESPF